MKMFKGIKVSRINLSMIENEFNSLNLKINLYRSLRQKLSDYFLDQRMNLQAVNNEESDSHISGHIIGKIWELL